MKRVAWVLGGGGRVGHALARQLPSDGMDLYHHDRPFRWSDASAMDLHFQAAAAEFAERTRAADTWEIYWSAGVGHMASTAEWMRTEEQLLKSLLNRLAECRSLLDARGRFVFVSSAGAIYDGSADTIIDEHSPIAPTSEYAHSKLRQEALVERSTLARVGNQVLLARASTLYGPAPETSSRRGLITDIARRMLRHQPISIYVPFDAVRDFLDVDDAARVIIATLRANPDGLPVRRKIIASEYPATVADVLGVFARLARRRLPVVAGARSSTSLYSHRYRFRTVVAPESQRLIRYTLATGIARLLAWEHTRMARTPVGREDGA